MVLRTTGWALIILISVIRMEVQCSKRWPKTSGSIDHYLSQDHRNRKLRGVSPPKRLSTIKTEGGRKVISFMTIADMDSHLLDSSGKYWRSPSARGTIKYSYDKASNNIHFEVKMFETIEYKGQMGYGNRGMELSELKVFYGRLYAVCDRTGIVFWLHGRVQIPWTIYADGNGIFEKPFKTEWMLIKDGKLYTGGYGKEWTDDDGEVAKNTGKNPQYVKIIDRNGRVKHVNWRRKFLALRRRVGISSDVRSGYMVHESAQWSKIHRKFFFLPRKVSHEPYDDKIDEKKGGHILLSANPSFTRIDKVNIYSDGKPPNKSRGFSSFQFIPETNDEVIVALKTVERDGHPLESYITIFNIHGKVYVRDTKIGGDHKFEGIEFIDWQHGYWNQKSQKKH
ncbi:apyrase domain-containing protein [Ditylenchus destructor]|nr:apyrase domain-containing protein [Ditylenchus destructor]